MRTSFVTLFSAVALVAANAPTKPSGEIPAPLVCAPGEVYGTQRNTKSYSAPVKVIDSVIGQFQEAAWQGLPVIATNGPDNTAGSSRTVTFGPLVLVEELQYYSAQLGGSKAEELQYFKLTNGPRQVSADVFITEYHERLALTPLCSNFQSSEIVWDVAFCYQGPESERAFVAGLFDGAHTGGLNNISTQAGLPEFTGCAKERRSVVLL